jgi:hypothetical protein
MAIQGRAWESNVPLDLGGVPVTGVLYNQVTVKYRKLGIYALTTKIVASTDWVEIGNGLYVIKWSSSEMNTVGPFLFQISGAGFDPYLEEFDIEPYPVSAIITPGTCIVTGNIVDLGAHPDQKQTIKFRNVKYPAAHSGAILSGAFIYTMPDAFGAFSVSLIRGSTVVIEIEGAGLKQQFVVPDQDSANILDLLPPINNTP